MPVKTDRMDSRDESITENGVRAYAIVPIRSDQGPSQLLVCIRSGWSSRYFGEAGVRHVLYMMPTKEKTQM